MTDDPQGLARKVMSGAVTELMTAGVHPAHIIEAMTKEMETLVQQMRNVDS
jgi:hypothetical protein